MVRTRVNSARGVRSSKIANSKSRSNDHLAKPDTFINVPKCLQDPPQIQPIDKLDEFQTTFNNFKNYVGEHMEWLRTKRETVTELLRENGVRVVVPRNSRFRQLADLVPVVVKEEPMNSIKEEPMSAVRTSRTSNETNTQLDNINETESTAPQVKDRNSKRTNQDGPKHSIIPEAQIKVEAVTPVVPSPPVRPLPASDTNVHTASKSNHTKRNDIKQEMVTSSESDIVKTPRKPEMRQTRACTRNAKIVAAAPTKAEEKIIDFENKMKAAQERKEKQEQRKVEKAKKDREEKALKVHKNLELQRAEAERKAEERRKREIAEEEVRRLNRSPARTRVPSVVGTPVRSTAISPGRNTPIRNKLASPARLVIPQIPGAARVQLFPSSTPRTPGRRPTKQSRVEELNAEQVARTPFESPIRELPRKVPPKMETVKKEVKKEEDIKKENISPIKKQSAGKVHDDFKNEQLRLLLGDDDSAEQKQKQVEAEKLRKEQERKEVERIAKEQEARRREEERQRAEAERRRLEEHRRAEEWRKAEEARLREIEREAERQKALEEEKRQLAEQYKQSHQDKKPVNKHFKDVLNTTMDVEDSEHDHSSYEMTQEKIFLPSTAENYNIEDLESGDETDDEGAPRKQVPAWASWTELYRTATAQYKDLSRNFDAMFGTLDNPHNQPIFNQNKTKKRARGSSAHWNSPVSNPTKGKSRFLGY